jgi:hypothetical protein
MGAIDLLQLAGQFGSTGLLVAYVIWDKQRTDSKWRAHEEKRLRQDEARVETDKALALAMQALTLAIRHD